MANGGNVTIKAILDVENFKSGINQVKSDLNGISADGLKSADSAMQGLGTSAEGSGQKTQSFVDRMSSAGKTVSSVGGTLSKTLTPALVGVGAASVAAAVTIDTSLTNVRKTVDGTEEQYQQLKDAAIEFSKTNAVSADQILDIQALGAQLGFSIDELQEFGEVVSGLDIATNMDAETAATEMAQFANITKMSHDEVRNYGSAIVDLGNNFATTEADISHMAMRIAAAGTQVGMSQADILGLSTALSSLGVEAEAGGTAISQTISIIDKAVSIGMDGMKEYALNSERTMQEVMSENSATTDAILADVKVWADAAGMSATEFANAWKNDPVDALAAVLAGMGEAADGGESMAVMLEDLGIKGIRQTDVLKRMAGNYELVGDAVDTANKAWEENTALQTEVDNRNNSLAAKFEMLKNRVIAVAEKIGGPLANALLQAIDAAEPLFQVIMDGAESFSQMDESQQRLIITVAALAAALGPVLTVVGKVMTSFKSISTVITSVGGVFKNLGSSASTAAAGMEKGTKAASGFGKGLSILKGSLVALGIAAVVTVIMSIVDAMEKAKQEAEEYSKATDGLGDAYESLYDSSGKFSDAMDESGEAAQKLADDIKETSSEIDTMITKHAEFADSMREAFTEANASVSELENYSQVIEDLYGRTDLTKREQAELANAIQQVGERCGEDLSMVKDANGAYVAMGDGAIYAKDSILQLIDAQQMQIKADVLGEQMKEAYKDQYEAAQTLAKAKKELNELGSEEANMTELLVTDANGATHAIQVQSDAYKEATANVEKAQEAYDTMHGTYERMADSSALLTQAQQEGAESIAYMVASNLDLNAALEVSNKSTLDFASTLAEAGVSAQEFGTLNQDTLMQLAENYDGTFGSIRGILEEHGVSFSEAAASVQENAQKIQSSLMTAGTSVKSAFVESKVDMEEFANSLANSGASIEQFRSLTEEQMTQVIELYGQNKEAGIQLFETLVGGFNNSTDAMVAFIESTAGLEEGFDFAGWAEQAGMSVQELAQVLTDFGVTVSDMQTMTTEQLQILVDNSGSSTDQIIEAFKNAGIEIPPCFQTAMDESVSALESGGEQAVSSAESTNSGVVDAFSPMENEVPDIANNAMDGYTSGISDAEGPSGDAADGVKTATIDGLEPGVDEAKTTGEDTGQGYADGIGSKEGEVRSSSENLGEASSEMKKYNGEAHGWGADLGQMFANGINAAIGWVQSAASAIANAAKSILHFSKPDTGPLKEGTEIYGRHLVEGFAKGMENRRDTVATLAEAMAADIRDKFDNLYDGLWQLPDDDLEKQGYEMAKGLSKGLSRGMGETPINWYSTAGIYDTLKIANVPTSLPTESDKTELAGSGGVVVNVNLSIDKFENRTDQDVNALSERLSRRMAADVQMKLKGRGVIR